jgi:signal transduction histidine kinase
MIRERPALIVPAGDMGMPEIRRAVADARQQEDALDSRREKMAGRLTQNLLKHLGGKTPAELDKIERVWDDPNFQHLLAKNPALVLIWLMVGEGQDKIHHDQSVNLYEMDLRLGVLRKRVAGDTESVELVDRIRELRATLQAFTTSLNAVLYSGRPVHIEDGVQIEKVVGKVLKSAFHHATFSEPMIKSTKVEVDISPDAAVLSTDENRLHLMLSNCMSNAIQAMETGGEMSGGVQHRLRITSKRVSIDGKDFVKIDIKDDGCGFDPTTKGDLFSPFFTTKDKGTGLGVPTTRQIAEELGGTFDLNSEGKGKGATATILLPLRQGG